MSFDLNSEQEFNLLPSTEQEPDAVADEQISMLSDDATLESAVLEETETQETPSDAFVPPASSAEHKGKYQGKFSKSGRAEEKHSEAKDEIFQPISQDLPELDMPAEMPPLFEDSIDAFPAEDLEEKPTEPEKKKRTRAVKKGRPRRKKGEGLLGIPNILVTVVWCALTLMISLTLGRLVWVCAAEVLAFGREDKNVTVTVYENDTIEDITKKLAREGLIRYPGLFKLYAQFAVDEGEIRPGVWDLNTKYDYHALVKMMSPSSSREVIKVTIPEGYTCRQIFSVLEDNKVCTAKDMESYAAYGELSYFWFLEGVTRGDKYCLEGFLFPDTYEFYKNDTPKNVLTKMLNNFGNRFDEDLQWKIQTLNAHLTDLMRRNGFGQDYIESHLFSVRDVVNVAAMIEKETSSVQEGYTIASVIYNRLFCWGTNPPYLNIDATIVYALNGKTDLTAEDLRVTSPYNTYTNMGLPYGPIANPGLASLKAALEPQDTNYYFYVLDPSVGSHHFSTTQAEHDAFRATLGG